MMTANGPLSKGNCYSLMTTDVYCRRPARLTAGLARQRELARDWTVCDVAFWPEATHNGGSISIDRCPLES